MLDKLFFVLATQNPLEMEGTYPLPEAQLDRFLFKLLVPFPINGRYRNDSRPYDRIPYTGNPPAVRGRLASWRCGGFRAEFRSATRFAATPSMSSWPRIPNMSWPVRLSRQFVRYGSSPRGAQAIILAAKITAILDERYHVARADIRAVAANCLRHRILLNFEGQAEDIKTDDIIEDVFRHAGKVTGSISSPNDEGAFYASVRL